MRAGDQQILTLGEGEHLVVGVELLDEAVALDVEEPDRAVVGAAVQHGPLHPDLVDALAVHVLESTHHAQPTIHLEDLIKNTLRRWTGR